MKAIYFDLDGTLLHFTESYLEILSACMVEMGKGNPQKNAEAYHENFHDVFMKQKENPYRKAAEGLIDEPDKFVEILQNKEISHTEPPENAASELRRISQDYKIGILTDGVRNWQMKKLRSSGLHEFFDTVIASYETDTFKNGLAPYKLAEERIEANKYAMVGDSIESDVEAAREFGWSAYHYQQNGFENIPEKLDW